jgi:hypothetical protein
MKKPANAVLPEEHLMFREKCMQLFERQIPGLEHREKRLVAIIEEIGKLSNNYPMYQFYLALNFSADDMVVNMRKLMMAELEQKARGGTNGGKRILKN